MIIGCGGGGGGGGTATSSTGTTSGTYHSPEVTGYVGSSAGPMLDTRNVYVGETVQLQITARDTSNNLVVLNGVNWVTTAPPTIATVTSAGVLTGIGSSSGKAYTIYGSYKGTRYSANLIVTAQQDLVTGIVRNASEAIASGIVLFYNASGKQVGEAYTTRDGSFQASVPSTATRFTINLSLVDPSSIYFYKEFAYGSNNYLEGTSCLAPLPSPLSAANATALPNDIVVFLQTLGPPPPPTGCQ